jgi:hypothetical protein
MIPFAGGFVMPTARGVALRSLGWVLACSIAVSSISVFAVEPQKGATTKPETRPGQAKSPPTAKPNPKLGPADVVRIVVEALKHNDAKDRGIAVAFDFASPANRRVTGPLSRFIPMVKGAEYRALLNHKSAGYSKVYNVDKNEAIVFVGIKDAGGTAAFYVFTLSKQPDGEYAGCWMTDGVQKVSPSDMQDKPFDTPEREEAPPFERA